MEVSPGVTKRLRGSLETSEAFGKGECVEMTCLACTTRMAHVKDVEGVICPVCLSMSPVEYKGPNPPVGVGLGIQLE